MRANIFILIAVLLAGYPISATIIHIPGDYPTIQEGVDACSEGDTVLIKPGVYHEYVQIYDVNIVLGSLFITTGNRDYIYTTIIDGDSIRSIMELMIYLDTTTVVSGITMRNGRGCNGGGVRLYRGILENNIIKDNFGNCWDNQGGVGILCGDSAIVRNNIIMNNTGTGSSGAWYYGGGIYCFGDGAKIAGNVIAYNSSCWGGGIALYNTDAIVERNIIYENIADP